MLLGESSTGAAELERIDHEAVGASIGSVDGATEIVSLSPAQLAWRRFRRNPEAIVGAAVIVVIVLLALLAPLICAQLHLDRNATYADHDPNLLDAFGFPNGPFSNASLEHPLGVDPGTGRDLLARLLYGARISLLVGILSTILTMLLGAIFGVVAGFRGGWIDSLLGRSMDVTLAFPVLLFAIAVFVILSKTDWYVQSLSAQIIAVVLILVLFSWPYVSRIVRGQVLSLREREFVSSALSIGSSDSRIVFRELMPNLMPLLLVLATQLFPGFIIAEAGFSFLGVGIIGIEATWGNMVNEALQTMQVDPFYVFLPSMAIFVTVLAFNLVGDGLRDATNTKETEL